MVEPRDIACIVERLVLTVISMFLETLEYLLFKLVSIVFVRKNVHKQLAFGFEKAVNLFEQVVVVFHVFKHCSTQNKWHESK